MRSLGLFFIAATLLPLHAQAPANAAEVTTKDMPVVFQSVTSLVPVMVVVRDKNGKAVGNLTAADFTLGDEGKPQYISKFAVEGFERREAPPQVSLDPSVAESATLAPAATRVAPPDRFIAYLLDDTHLQSFDLLYVREAALRQMERIGPETRAAVFTTSGLQVVDFTSDHQKLAAAVAAVQPAIGHLSTVEVTECPPISYYLANMIEKYSDAEAINMADAAKLLCPVVVTTGLATTAVAQRISALGDMDSRNALDTLRSLASRMAAMPGDRAIVLISPGFQLFQDFSDQFRAMVDQALRAKVMISAVQSRGRSASVPGADTSVSRLAGTDDTKHDQLGKRQQRDIEQAGYNAAANNGLVATLEEITSATGGALVRNSDDLDDGFRRAAERPEFSYVLSFSPRDLKFDGKYHKLRVALNGKPQMTVQFRHGYYAPAKATDPAELTQQFIEESLFSGADLHDLPIVVQTQFFKTGDGEANLSVIATVDAGKLVFRKEADRNRNDLTVAAALFDENGIYVAGGEKIVTLRLREATLQSRADRGISVKNSFTVKPGKYRVRLLVRDADGQSMGVQTAAVEIP